MKALKRLAASTMLSLALVAGVTESAFAQTYICFYDHTDVYVGPGGVLIVDHYYCY